MFIPLSAEEQAVHVVMDFLDAYDNRSLFDRELISDVSDNKRQTPEASQAEEAKSSSSGSILKTSKNYRPKPAKDKKRYSLFYTEKPTQKAYISKFNSLGDTGK